MSLNHADTVAVLSAVVGFTPASLTGIKAWYSATRSTFSLTGSSVDQWDNAGPATPDATGSGTARPTKGTDAGNYAKVLFDGTDDVLTTGATVATLVGSGTFGIMCCISIVANNTNAANADSNNAVIADTGGNIGLILKLTSSPFTVHGYMWDGAYKVTSGLSLASNTKAILAMWHDGTNLKAAINNGTAVTVASGVMTSTTGTVRIGAMATGANAHYANVNVYDIVVMDAAPTTQEQTDYYTFCQAEYGASVPVGTRPTVVGTPGVATTLTPTYPSGIASGDLLVFAQAVTGEPSSIISTVSFSQPGGWSNILDHVSAEGGVGRSARIRLWTKTATGSESGTVAGFGSSGGTGTLSVISAIVAVHGANSTAGDLQSSNGIDNPVNAPNLTASATNRLGLLFALYGDDTGAFVNFTGGSGSDFTVLAQTSSAGGSDRRLAVFSANMDANTSSKSESTARTADEWVVAGMVLTPA